jgi:hypothetical protein
VLVLESLDDPLSYAGLPAKLPAGTYRLVFPENPPSDVQTVATRAALGWGLGEALTLLTLALMPVGRPKLVVWRGAKPSRSRTRGRPRWLRHPPRQRLSPPAHPATLETHPCQPSHAPRAPTSACQTPPSHAFHFDRFDASDEPVLAAWHASLLQSAACGWIEVAAHQTEHQAVRCAKQYGMGHHDLRASSMAEEVDHG